MPHANSSSRKATQVNVTTMVISIATMRGMRACSHDCIGHTTITMNTAKAAGANTSSPQASAAITMTTVQTSSIPPTALSRVSAPPPSPAPIMSAPVARFWNRRMFLRVCPPWQVSRPLQEPCNGRALC